MKHIARAASALFAAAALLLGGGARAGSSEPWPDIALPDGAKGEWISDDMKVDNLPMRLLHFTSDRSRAEVTAFYTAHWSGGYPTKPSVQTAPDATVVGQAHGPYFMTVKILDRDASASEGFLAVSQVLGNEAKRDAGGLPLLPDAKILSVVESSDPGKKSRVVTARQDNGVDAATDWYEAALTNAGWRLASKTAADPKGGAAGYLETFRKGADEISVSVQARRGERGSTVVENLVTKGTGGSL